MKRKDFLKATALTGASLSLGRSMVHASNLMESPLLKALAYNFNSCGRALVIVQLTGGNDGLNFIIPLDGYASLVKGRPNVVPAQSSILSLNNNPTSGMHPALTELRNLYNNGKVNIVQGVSYNNPNFSHFRATDIWHSGSDSTQVLSTGWLGRYLETDNPGYPTGYPNTNMPDPLAIQIGSTLPLSLQASQINVGYNVSDPQDLINVINATTDPVPNNDYGRELKFIRLMKDQSNAYTNSIRSAYNSASTLSTQYPDEDLANQLKIVARLVKGGLKTPLYIVNHPNSFDDHDGQVVQGNPLQGKHPTNMSILSKAIGAFQNDIELMGISDKVCGMTFSEFGRNIKGNGSLGTDHGVAAPVIFFGDGVKGGMVGTSPVLPDNPQYDDHVAMQFDYRQLYSTVLQSWLCMTSSATDGILLNNYPALDIFKTNTALAIQLVSFTAGWQNNNALLKWQVASTTDIENFDAQVSDDGKSFTSIAIVPINTAKTAYELFHNQISGLNYYRIVTTEKSGEKSYSQIVRLRKTKTGEGQVVVISPNPLSASSKMIRLNLLDNETGTMQVHVYNETGNLVYQFGRNLAGENTVAFTISSNLSVGAYIVWISLPSGYKKAHKIIVAK
jgi:uncharacterized protein (DUF1501 family)